MSGVRGPVVFCVLAAIVAPAVYAQTRPLNPTVRVLEKPQSIIPTDCDEGLAPAAPRPPVEAPAEVLLTPATVAPPPASDLRTALRRVQAAAEGSDYATFKDAIADARAAVARYPNGGEKNAASEVLQVYGDLERLWDFSFNSSTGSFFDASSADGTIIAALRKYPEFTGAVADATMNIGGQTIYPARETRLFLAEEAAKRLGRLGVRTPSRVVRETPVERPAATPAGPPAARRQEVQRGTETVTPRRSTTSTTKRETATAPRKTPPEVADVTPRRETPRRETTTRVTTARVTTAKPQPQPQPQASRQPAPITPAPTTPAPAPVTKTEAPPPIVDTTPATTTTASQTTSTSTTDFSTGAPTDTAPSAEPATTTAAPKPAEPARSRGVNLPFAIILIVIGLAVLVLLFRSSD